jgi:hypothetical protein
MILKIQKNRLIALTCINSKKFELLKTENINVSHDGAGGGIRTHERLRDKVLSLAPLTRLGNPRPHHVKRQIQIKRLFVKEII